MNKNYEKMISKDEIGLMKTSDISHVNYDSN